MKYPFRNKTWLIEQIDKYGYVASIAKHTNYSKTSIKRYIDKYNLNSMLRKPSECEKEIINNYEKYPYKNKEWLQEQIDKYETIVSICKNTGYASTSIRRYIKLFELDVKKPSIPRILNINENYFETINTEHKAYWLGLLVADGNVSDLNKKYCIRITLKNEDMYLPYLFLKDVESSSKIYIDKHDRATARVFSKKMFNDLVKLGVVPNKTGKETIPVDIPSNLFNHFVRGFFDGDGTIYKRKNRKRHKCTIGLVCQNQDFLQDLNTTINQLIKCDFGNVVKHKNNAYECKTESYEKCKTIMNWIYKDATICMIRKYELSKKYLNINCPSLEQFKEESRLIAGTNLELQVLN